MGHRNMGTTNSGGNNWYDRNEALQTINRRRSIRQFADRPLTDHDIKLVLQAANMAPSAHNQQQQMKFVKPHRYGHRNRHREGDMSSSR
jgi:nitroreductase